MRWARRASRPATCAEDLHERNTAQQRSAADYLYYTVSGLMYPGTQRLYRKPLSGGAPASVLNGVTDVRRNAQQGGAHMLGTTATGLVRIAQPDDASPGTSTHPLAGLRQALALQPVIIGPDRSTSTRQLGRRRYELTDHLGNVRVVLGDRKLSDFDPQNTPIPTHFSAEVMAYADYDPFGSLLPGRHADATSATSATYRFAFQGQEKDDEIHDDPGTSYAFEYRIHDARVGRFLSIDPLAAQYPHNSPYAFSENRVIDSNELEGLETIPGGQVVSKTDLLGETVLTHATESTLTPFTQWDTQVVLPVGGPTNIPGPGLRKDGERLEAFGDIVQVASLPLILGQPEVGLPAMTAGGLISGLGTGMQVVADWQEGKKENALLRLGVEVFFGALGSVAKRGVGTLNLPTHEAAVAGAGTEATIELTKKGFEAAVADPAVMGIGNTFPQDCGTECP